MERQVGDEGDAGSLVVLRQVPRRPPEGFWVSPQPPSHQPQTPALLGAGKSSRKGRGTGPGSCAESKGQHVTLHEKPPITLPGIPGAA